MTEVEKFESINGKDLYALKDFSVFVKYDKYRMAYAGSDVYIGLSDNILNKKIEITPEELQSCFSESNPVGMFSNAKFGDHYLFDDGNEMHDCIFCCETSGSNSFDNSQSYIFVYVSAHNGEEKEDRVTHIYASKDGTVYSGGSIKKPERHLMTEEYLLDRGYIRFNIEGAGELYGVSYTHPDKKIGVYHVNGLLTTPSPYDWVVYR